MWREHRRIFGDINVDAHELDLKNQNDWEDTILNAQYLSQIQRFGGVLWESSDQLWNTSSEDWTKNHRYEYELLEVSLSIPSIEKGLMIRRACVISFLKPQHIVTKLSINNNLCVNCLHKRSKWYSAAICRSYTTCKMYDNKHHTFIIMIKKLRSKNPIQK